MGRGKVNSRQVKVTPRTRKLASHTTNKTSKFLDTLWTQQKSRINNLKKLVELAEQQHCLPEDIVLPDFYSHQYTSESDLNRLFLSERLKIDQAISVIMNRLHRATDSNDEISQSVYDQACKIYFSQSEKDKARFAIECLTQMPFENKDMPSVQAIERLNSFIEKNKFWDHKVAYASAAAEQALLLKTFPAGSLQKKVFDQIEKRMKDGSEESFYFLAQAERYATCVVASGIDPKSKELINEYQKAVADISETFFDGEGKIEFAIPVPNLFMVRIESGKDYNENDYTESAAGQNIPFFQETIYVNSSLKDIDIDSDYKKKLRYLILHETVHSTQNFDDIMNRSCARNTLIGTLEGVTETETWEKLRAHNLDPWLENGMRRKSTGRYLGFQFIIRQALANKGKSASQSSDYRFLLDDFFASEEYLSEALFGKSNKQVVTSSEHKSGTPARFREQSVQRLRLDYLFKTAYDSADELNSLEHNPEVFENWAKDQIKRIKKIRRSDLEKDLAS